MQPDETKISRQTRGAGKPTKAAGALMRDREVRKALHSKVLREHHGQANTLVLDELGLRHGTVRVDIAVVNGFLHGYEIKSDADTLDRLPSQVDVYGKVLDRATLVVGERHVAKAKASVPEWWGIKIVCAGPRGGVDFDTIRAVQMNPGIEPLALAELLWRDEVAAILQHRGVAAKVLRQPRGVLYKHLVDITPLDELRATIRQELKAREHWRGQRPPSSDDGLSPPTPR
jgi:hypothetical protein